jgi:hypothetical protein
MPPKSLITSLIGQRSKTFYEEISKNRLLFDLGLAWPSSDTDEEVTRSSSSTANQSQTSTPTPVSISAPIQTVPRSVRVQPEVAEVLEFSHKGATLQIRQLWEGTVMEVRGQAFVAVLSDKTQPNSPDERVEFERFELRDEDRELVAPGAVFYWMIGTERTASGQVRNISTIELSRLPLWTRSSLKAACEKTARTKQWFQANGNHPA